MFKRSTPGAEVNVHLTNPNIHLSEASLHNMKNDQRSYQDLIENFLQDARTLINKGGINETCGDEIVLRLLSKNEKYVLSYNSSLDELMVKKNNFLLAYRRLEQAGVGDRFVTQRDASLFKHMATRQ